jgi:hypothetical protein
MEAPQNGRFFGKMKCLALWPTYIGEKGRTLGKTYGITVRCYWEHPWGTHWEPDGNLKGTCQEQRKNEKNPLPDAPHPPSKNFTTKKSRQLVHAEPSH